MTMMDKCIDEHCQYQPSHDWVVFKDSATVEFSVTENEDGEKEITAEAIGGNDHPRAHQIDSIEDHPAVPAEKRNRWVHTNAETGEIELIEQGPQGDPGLTPFYWRKRQLVDRRHGWKAWRRW